MIKVDQNHVQAVEPCIFFHRKKIQLWFSLKTVSRPRLCRYSTYIYIPNFYIGRCWKNTFDYSSSQKIMEVEHGSLQYLVLFILGSPFPLLNWKKWYLYALKPNLRNWRFGIGMEYLGSQHPRVLLQHHATLHHFWCLHFLGEMSL